MHFVRREERLRGAGYNATSLAQAGSGAGRNEPERRTGDDRTTPREPCCTVARRMAPAGSERSKRQPAAPGALNKMASFPPSKNFPAPVPEFVGSRRKRDGRVHVLHGSSAQFSGNGGRAAESACTRSATLASPDVSRTRRPRPRRTRYDKGETIIGLARSLFTVLSPPRRLRLHLRSPRRAVHTTWLARSDRLARSLSFRAHPHLTTPVCVCVRIRYGRYGVCTYICTYIRAYAARHGAARREDGIRRATPRALSFFLRHARRRDRPDGDGDRVAARFRRGRR